MPTAFALYTTLWITACLIAAAVAVVQRRRIELFDRAYWRFLARPWRLTTFLVAAVSLIVVAPYTGDPTWDYVDATFMSVLALQKSIRGFRWPGVRRPVCMDVQRELVLRSLHLPA